MPGTRQQIPLIISEISIPTLDASYRAAIIVGSTREFSFHIILASLPAFLFSISLK